MKKINLELGVKEEQCFEEIRNLVQGHPVEDSFLVKKQITIFANLLKRSRKDMKEIFSTEELYFLFDIFNGANCGSSDANLQTLILIEIYDAVEFGNLDEKWGINSNTLMQKIKSLTGFQALVLITVMNKFWNNCFCQHGIEPERSLQK